MSEQDKTQAPRENEARKPGRKFRIVLGVSLALNLLVIGAVVGVIAKGPSSRGGPPGLREISAPYVGAFDRQAKREMRGEMRKKLPPRSDSIAANKADYAAFLDVVRAPVFDAQRALQIMESQLARAGELQKVGRDLAIDRISEMSLEQREAYAARLEEWLENRKGRKSRKER